MRESELPWREVEGEVGRNVESVGRLVLYEAGRSCGGWLECRLLVEGGDGAV